MLGAAADEVIRRLMVSLQTVAQVGAVTEIVDNSQRVLVAQILVVEAEAVTASAVHQVVRVS
jgi:hypothetical protein